MLKIKDNVDLKELEKFGFKYWKNTHVWNKPGRNILCDECADYYVTGNRSFQINTYNGDYTIDDIVYDLIKADMVEKVEE